MLAKSIMLVFGLILLPNISDGHHSHVNYFVSEFTHLEGIVREFTSSTLTPGYILKSG